MSQVLEISSKPCSACQMVKPLSEFGLSDRVKDGHRARCRACEAAYSRARYHTDAVYRRRQIDRGIKRNRLGYHREYMVRYRVERSYKPEIGSEARNRARQTFNQNHPEKVAAWSAVRDALKAGHLVRRPCCVCGSVNATAHHENYSKPLDVMWFCRRHHGGWHRLFVVEPNRISQPDKEEK